MPLTASHRLTRIRPVKFSVPTAVETKDFTNMVAAQLGDVIRIHYETRSKQGNMIETSEHREPFEFIVGSPEVIEGLNLAVVGLQVGERKHVIVSPDQAFGERDSRLQQNAPRRVVKDQIEEGDQLIATCAGEKLDVWVRTVNDEEVSLDANHPLAGESLVLDIEVIGIEPEVPADASGESDALV